MNILFEHHYEVSETAAPSNNPDSLAEMNVIIYDSVRKDYAILVSWQDGCIRSEWGIVTGIDQVGHQIKLLRDDGSWWIPISKLLKVERV